MEAPLTCSAGAPEEPAPVRFPAISCDLFPAAKVQDEGPTVHVGEVLGNFLLTIAVRVLGNDRLFGTSYGLIFC